MALFLNYSMAGVLLVRKILAKGTRYSMGVEVVHIILILMLISDKGISERTKFYGRRSS